ncbi:MAG: alanine--tRNA ligase-related protein [bacterium]
MTSKEVRQKYLEFFKAREHSIIPSASLIPENDPSLLFVNSGMFPLVPYLSGQEHPNGKRLVDSQKCFRAEDIDIVGDNKHNTFFEMLGNWSLGDYFKKEQLEWWYEFLINDLGLDINRLYQTVYAGDEKIEKDNESVAIMKNIYKQYGLEAEEGLIDQEIDFTKQRIFAYGADKNWWQRGDAVGELGGPDSETFYDTGKKHDPAFGKHCHPNCECGRFIEIGNSVFMQYQKTVSGWDELKHKNVDFGGGLERITMAINNLDNIYKTDLFTNIIKKIEELSNKKYLDNKEDSKAFEIIADHLKAATFLMAEDARIEPTNTDQGYIIRRLIRRAIRYGNLLGIKQENWTMKIAKIVIADYTDIYPLAKQEEFIVFNLEEEEKKFSRTLEKGLREFEKIRDRLMDSGDFNKFEKFISHKNKKPIPGHSMKIGGGERVHITTDEELKNAEISGKEAFNLYQTSGFPIEMTEELAKMWSLGVEKEGFYEELKKHQELSRTASVGKFKGGLADHSIETTKLHTAAHLLLAALRKVLGSHVEQRGSNITGDRLRFDFTHPEKMTDEEKEVVEQLVNEAIQRKLPVTCCEMTLEEAKEAGAVGVFESKYGDKVRAYKVGENNNVFSHEICGGPHVENTKELGRFRIVKEMSSSSGIRRIKAILE